MSQDAEPITLLAKRVNSVNREAGGKFDAAARGDLYAFGREGWVISYGCQQRDIEHRCRSSCVQRQAQDDAAGRPEYLGLNHNKSAFGIERIVHKTTAVCSGISPV